MFVQQSLPLISACRLANNIPFTETSCEGSVGGSIDASATVVESKHHCGSTMKFNGYMVALVLSFLAPAAAAPSSNSLTWTKLFNNINDLLYRGTDRFTSK